LDEDAGQALVWGRRLGWRWVAVVLLGWW
jgi:hypothetical protein